MRCTLADAFRLIWIIQRARLSVISFVANVSSVIHDDTMNSWTSLNCKVYLLCSCVLRVCRCLFSFFRRIFMVLHMRTKWRKDFFSMHVTTHRSLYTVAMPLFQGTRRLCCKLILKLFSSFIHCHSSACSALSCIRSEATIFRKELFAKCRKEKWKWKWNSVHLRLANESSSVLCCILPLAHTLVLRPLHSEMHILEFLLRANCFTQFFTPQKDRQPHLHLVSRRHVLSCDHSLHFVSTLFTDLMNMMSREVAATGIGVDGYGNSCQATMRQPCEPEHQRNRFRRVDDRNETAEHTHSPIGSLFRLRKHKPSSICYILWHHKNRNLRTTNDQLVVKTPRRMQLFHDLFVACSSSKPQLHFFSSSFHALHRFYWFSVAFKRFVENVAQVILHLAKTTPQ